MFAEHKVLAPARSVNWFFIFIFFRRTGGCEPTLPIVQQLMSLAHASVYKEKKKKSIHFCNAVKCFVLLLICPLVRDACRQADKPLHSWVHCLKNTTLSGGTAERRKRCKRAHSVSACFHALDVQEKRLDFSVQKTKMSKHASKAEGKRTCPSLPTFLCVQTMCVLFGSL